MSDTHWPVRSNGAAARGVGGAAGPPRPPRCAYTRTLNANAGRRAINTAALVRPNLMIHSGLENGSTSAAPRLCLSPPSGPNRYPRYWQSLGSIGIERAGRYPRHRYAPSMGTILPGLPRAHTMQPVTMLLRARRGLARKGLASPARSA